MTELKSCPICSGEKVLYQHTVHTKLYLDTFGEASALITECTPCPPYAKCSMNGFSANSAFVIKYCPECGRDLSTRTQKEGEKMRIVFAARGSGQKHYDSIEEQMILQETQIVKNFAHYLIDRSEGGKIEVCDIADFAVEYMNRLGGKSSGC